MKAEVRTITPELAKELLKNNATNRPIRNLAVANYAQEMLKGQWKLTGQGIQISEFGNLIDGQHRLNALIKANMSLPFLIVYEVRESSFDVLDQGVKRSAGDVLAINNISDYTTKAAIISAYLIMRNMNNPSATRIFMSGGQRLEYKISNTDVLNFFNENENICNEVTLRSGRYYKKFNLITKTLYGAVCLYLILDKRHRDELVYSFMEQLSSGVNIECNSIYILRQKLINSHNSNFYKIDPKHKNKLLIKTWNDFATGRNNVKHLSIDIDKEYSFI